MTCECGCTDVMMVYTAANGAQSITYTCLSCDRTWTTTNPTKED